MPQMSPIWWTTMFMMFIITYMFIMTIMYFYNIYESKFMKSKKFFNKNLIWKW